MNTKHTAHSRWGSYRATTNMQNKTNRARERGNHEATRREKNTRHLANKQQTTKQNRRTERDKARQGTIEDDKGKGQEPTKQNAIDIHGPQNDTRQQKGAKQRGNAKDTESDNIKTRETITRRAGTHTKNKTE